MQAAISSKAKDLAKRLSKPSLHQDERVLVRQLVNQVRLKPEAKGYVISLNLNVLAECLEIAPATTKSEATITTELKLKVCNNGKKVIIGNKPSITAQPNASMINSLKLAHEIKAQYLGQASQSLTDVAKIMNMNKRQVWRNLKIAFLAPDMQLAILSGTQPKGLCLQDMLDAHISIDWSQQRKTLGFI